MQKKINFPMKGWAAGLALKKRPKIIRKWSINNFTTDDTTLASSSHSLAANHTHTKKQRHCENLGGSGDFSRAHSIATNCLKLTC